MPTKYGTEFKFSFFRPIQWLWVAVVTALLAMGGIPHQMLAWYVRRHRTKIRLASKRAPVALEGRLYKYHLGSV
jgi:hypothetical protein